MDNPIRKIVTTVKGQSSNRRQVNNQKWFIMVITFEKNKCTDLYKWSISLSTMIKYYAMVL